MDEENSNEVVLIEITEDEDSRHSPSSTQIRPLMSLFERLISNDTKSNTVLTNAQILLILEKEFNMNISALHELEVDIYINIVKKFLKDWPQWDSFDRIMNILKKRKSYTKIKDILEQKYKHLKEYLQSMIDTAKPLAEDALKKLDDLGHKAQDKPNEDDDNMVLEIYSTRKMLNTFIFNRPNPAQNNTLFNLTDFEPYKLKTTTKPLSFSSMLHWYGVKLTIDLPFLYYTRFSEYKLKHVIVNEANGPRALNKELEPGIYMKTTSVTKDEVPIANIKNILDIILHRYTGKPEHAMIQAIFNVLKNDLSIDSPTIEVPGSYKLHLSKYPYVRKLFANVEEGPSTPHNLFMEETVTPIQNWHIGKYIHVGHSVTFNNSVLTWLKFECEECKQKFHGAEFLTMLCDHFRVYHCHEPDWSCTNCQKSLSMAELTDRGWQHNC